MSSTRILEKYQGCLLGGLIGDCFGAPFEFRNIKPQSVADLINEKMVQTDRSNFLRYTDDTEMARSVSQSFLEKECFDPVDMAHRFAKEFFNKPARAYGAFVRHVFKSIKDNNYKDVFEPARKQFNGHGSFGNGGAMRTHPVALFGYKNNDDEVILISRQTAKLTHSHMDGYNGAILLTMAIRWALRTEVSKVIDQDAFLNELIEIMTTLETTRSSSEENPSFCEQLQNIKMLLNRKVDPSIEEVVKILGNDVIAVKSVPAAIYAFLRAQKPVEEYQTTNSFLRILYLSVSMGGDTDTIGCMACSLAGAYYGVPLVLEELYKHCEGWEFINNQAEQLFALVIWGQSPRKPFSKKILLSVLTVIGFSVVIFGVIYYVLRYK